jgi:hypothetical protein
LTTVAAKASESGFRTTEAGVVPVPLRSPVAWPPEMLA